MKKYAVIALLTLFESGLYAWGAGAGTTGVNYTKIEPFARPAALAEAYAAVSDGTYGLFYNPAGLGTILGYEAQLSHISWYHGINLENFAIVNPDPLLDWGKIGIAITYANPGEMRSADELDGYDYAYLNSGVNIGSCLGDGFTPYGFNITLGYSLDPAENLSVGLNIKLTNEYAIETKGSSLSFDVGTIYRALFNGNYLRAGLVIGNIGFKTGFGAYFADQPFYACVGISDLFLVNDWDFLLTTQVTAQYESAFLFGMGAEWWIYDMAAIRVGIKIGDTIQPSFGTGVRYGQFECDYAFMYNEDFGFTHRVSLLASWGTPPVRLSVAPYMISPNNDNFLDRAYFTPDLREKQMLKAVRINIYEENGKKPLVVITPGNINDSKAEWDGKKDGKPVRDGKYYASVEAEYEINGISESGRVELEVDSTPPDVSLEAGPVYKVPGKEDALLVPVTFTFFAKDKNKLDRWQFVIWDEGKKVYFTQSGRGTPPLSVTWNGKGMDGSYAKTNREYYYSFIAYDNFGNKGVTPPVKRLLLVKEIRIIFSSDALFDPGEADVKVGAYQSVKEMKNVIAQYPGTKLIVAGHTDDIPPSGHKYADNRDLAKKRADAVKFFMVNFMGIEEGRIVTEGHGDSYPIAPNDTPENRAKNRRVEVIIRSLVIK
ncbi:MAG: PorV/PorQ family protein [Spirochaetia bacterium]|nr:PorV/PorQ family protein [Spirochaetia bacterium]